MRWPLASVGSGRSAYRRWSDRGLSHVQGSIGAEDARHMSDVRRCGRASRWHSTPRPFSAIGPVSACSAWVHWARWGNGPISTSAPSRSVGAGRAGIHDLLPPNVSAAAAADAGPAPACPVGTWCETADRMVHRERRRGARDQLRRAADQAGGSSRLRARPHAAPPSRALQSRPPWPTRD